MAVKFEALSADKRVVSDGHTPAAPAAFDVVEIIDPHSPTRLKALVESVDDRRFVLRLERAASVPDEAPVRWFDGGTAWQASSRIARISETSVNCQLPPAPEWEPAPVRQSLRAPVDNAPMLARIAESTVLPKGKRVHAVCLDISNSGCRASWPGPVPAVGDVVEVAWDVGDWHSQVEPSWINARVARVVAGAFGARQVGFRFDTDDATQIARVHAWHQAWLREHRRRAAG
jgi:hypothetical protein